MPETKTRARLLILNHIVQFSLARRYGDHVTGGLRDMAFVSGSSETSIPGDLVALQSAPSSKWYLGWLISKQWPEGHACEQYTIESIEDGELCNWSNVGLIFYDRSQIQNHPEWRWTDQQHEFNSRWFRVCKDERDAYIYLPVQAEFDQEGSGVLLRTRTRFAMDDTVPERYFDNWRKVTKAMMLEFYDAAVAEARAAAERKKAEREAAAPLS